MKSSAKPKQTSLGRLVTRFMTAMHRFDGGRTLPVLHASKLTTAQLAVLELVRVPCTVSAVAGHLGLSRPATSQLVQKLVQRGLVRRSEGAADRRERDLALSDAGESLVAAIAAARSARFEAALAALPQPTASRLASGLAAALEALQGAPAGHPDLPSRRRQTS